MTKDSNLPDHWEESEALVQSLILKIGPDATKAALLATYDVQAQRYKENPSGDNYAKLQFSMNSLQIIQNEVKR